jgi:hypothetical protein
MCGTPAPAIEPLHALSAIPDEFSGADHEAVVSALDVGILDLGWLASSAVKVICLPSQRHSPAAESLRRARQNSAGIR